MRQKAENRQANYLRNDRTVSDSYLGVQTHIGITENNLTSTLNFSDNLLEFILSPSNLNEAYHQVKRNKGAGGIDKMDVSMLKDHLLVHKDQLVSSLLSGSYRPNPVRRVYIPKDNGSMRGLGIPTVVDRFVQQSISQLLTKIYEPHFSDSSFGFRPKRNAHQALKRCKDIIDSGYRYAVDLDLEKYFDTVNHSKLIEILSRRIQDGRVVSLIHKYLNSGVMLRGRYVETKSGVPQGGPLSPILSNIMLNELDKELERRGHKFVRYADDLVIFCKSKRATHRVMASITKFIEEKLFLKVNKEKSQCCFVGKVKFLGYSFGIYKGLCKLRIHHSSVQKMKTRLRTLTSRSNGWGNEKRKLKLREYIRGWVNYFKHAESKKLLKKTDEWLRRRLRMVIWKQWKHIKTRYKNLIKLGINKYKAYQWANTRKSYWRTASSFILTRTITNDRLKQSGYIFLYDYYRKVKV